MTPHLLHYDLGPDVTAFSTNRHGGYSTGAYGELNINPYCGDDPAAVTKNRKALATVLTLQPEDIVLPHQVHGTVCRVIDAHLLGLGHCDAASQVARVGIVPPSSLEGVDAVLTNQRGLCIGVSTADCIPLLLYDADHHAVAAIHAGWRGTVQRIAEVAVRTMMATYGTDPMTLKAVIGPGISLRNFEVGQEVYDAFAAAGFDMQCIARRFPLMQPQQTPQTSTSPSVRSSVTKWHLDLPLCNKLQLQAAGLKEENIQLSGICTYDRVSDFFSARRLGAQSGRIFTGLVLR